ncbi:hypothetical protein DFA_10432 [Cavenderia fasciculata]|uniref:Uncharacterized protein n=1 Tax=Cavenderia fasciculata TaxID=261658 RepID=F4QA71_CACFS|nr:uncharacterized protein DFA_10432 [Cavenderia fasciculata]EGG15590.1 hypothetical protein DFA_10432 [Cavenderia fasciculata]|eukprot:XP_004354332.1 hypothetical protein DFA_10432 [Cavenderia fasciculata]
MSEHHCLSVSSLILSSHHPSSFPFFNFTLFLALINISYRGGINCLRSLKRSDGIADYKLKDPSLEGLSFIKPTSIYIKMIVQLRDYQPLTKDKVKANEDLEDKAKPFSDAFYDKMRASAANYVKFYATEYIQNKTKSLANLVSYSCFENGDIYTDQVRKLSDKYFLDVVYYYMDDGLRSLMKWDKPALDNRLLEISSSAKVVAWYKKYATLYVHYLASEETTGKIKTKVVEADLKAMTSSKIYVKQTSAIYHYAFLMYIPWMALYIHDNPAKWTEELKNYYLTSPEFAKIWIQNIQAQYQKEQNFQKIADIFANAGLKKEADLIANLPREYNSLDYMISNARNKLDMLDPSGKTSTAVTTHLYSSSYAFFYILSGKENKPEQKKALEKQIGIAVDHLASLKESELSGERLDMYRTFKDTVSACGNLAGVKTQLGMAIKNANDRMKPYLKNIDVSKYDDLLKMPTMESNAMEASVKESTGPLKKVPYCLKFCMGMWRGCQAISVFYGLYNFKSADTVGKVQAIADLVTIALDTFTIFGKADKAFTSPFATLSKVIATQIHKVGVQAPKVLSGIFNLMKGSFAPTFNNFLSFRVCPALIVIAVVINAMDAVKSFQEAKWGELACDLVQLGANLASIAILVAGASWSGPVALVLGGICIIAAFIKYIITKTPVEEFLESSYLLPQSSINCNICIDLSKILLRWSLVHINNKTLVYFHVA